MLRETNGRHSSMVVVACNKCGGECDESRQHATDATEAVGWNGAMALASARSAGWVERLEGRVLRQFCPKCA
jgi:hypothetical protein